MEFVTDLVAKRAELAPRRIAMIEPSPGGGIVGRHLTYGQLNERAARAAGALKHAGVKPGDRVGVLCRNRIAFFELLFGCAKLGAILVPLNWRMPAPELAQPIADANPRLLFAGMEDWNVARDACEAAGVMLIGFDDPGAHGYDARLEQAVPLEGRARWPANEPWYLLGTSGTTGRAKAVIQTPAMALVNAINIGQAIDIRRDDVTLNFLPLFHTAGINLHTLPVLMNGGAVVVTPGFDVETTLKFVEAGALTVFFGVPAVYQALAQHPRFETLELTGVRRWGCGGAPLADALAERFRERGAVVCNGFGMTETGPTVFIQDPATAPRKTGSVGRAQLLTQARVVDAKGIDVAPGEIGEIWIAGPGITPGYWNQPEATRAAITADGWLKTGDLGRRDPDGDMWIVGRIKEMYISGGENVYPAEVENVLAGHPDVIEAAIVGVADAQWGEVGKAYVLMRQGARLDAAALTRFCRARLAPFKAPKIFVPVADFPRTAAGKVIKDRLADLEAAQ